MPEISGYVEYCELEGIHMDHCVQLFPAQENPQNHITHIGYISGYMFSAQWLCISVGYTIKNTAVS